MNFFQKSSNCCVCHKELMALKLRKIYRCKKCHQDVCHYCSENRIQLYCLPNEFVKDPSQTQRVCDLCFKDFEFCQRYIQEYHLRWNTKSFLYPKWLGKEERRIKIKQSTNFPDKETIEKDVATGRSDAHLFNYSVREFISQCQQGYDKQYIRESITRVLDMLVAHHPIIGYCQGMNQLATFILCISDEEGAFHILNHLFTSIIPPRFYSNSSGAALIGYQAEQHFLKQMLKSYDTINSENLCKFLELYGPQFLLTLMLQVLNTSSIFIVWGQMFKLNSFIPIDQALLFIFINASQQIDVSKSGCIELLGKLISYEQLQAIYQIENKYFTSFERQIQIEQYYSQTSRSWVNNDKLILFRLKKITQFDPDEILQIQTEFKKFCMEQVQVQISKSNRQSFKQQNQLTDSSDDDDIEYLQELQIQQIKLQKYGINQDAFIHLMELFHQSYTKYEKLDKHKYKLIFTLFDENHSGLLDFREFLTCLSVLLRGTFDQKLQMFFSAHTRSILKNSEFKTLLSLIIPLELQELPDYQDFLQRIQLSTYSYLDMLQVAQDPFIIENQQQRNRSQTTIILVDSFNKINK